ncbi:tumor susceptibility gene 101 protein [Aplysia californica]|uniref:Tumor susceptibility gene 101 protein n=1 Tax=Aplysia californica TaxID=6500 RepID=A0ABM0JMJ5_APLCA|nr:tumor susceptibility gene 101 protein [Aplysia californica]
MAQHEGLLKSYLSKYKHPVDTKTEIINTIKAYRDLRPSLEPFVFNDGTQRELVHLEGTIPVNYRGNVYNIPISIWVLDTHPYNPPMVFVKPTASMQIKPGQYVDANGKVDMPVIRDWRHPTSDLLGLVQILTFTFGEECPVFSRSANQRSSNQPLTYPGQTPYPSNPAGGMPMPGMPPYPPAGGVGGPSYPGYPPYSTPSSYPSGGGGGNPPYPAYPPTSQNNSYPPVYPPASANTPYPSHMPSQQPPGPPYPGSGGGYPPSQYQAQPPYPTANNVGNSNGLSQLTPGGTVTEDDIRASLLSAVEDKMKRRLRETFAQAQAEMDVLTKTQKDLTQGKQKLETIISDLEKEKNEIDRNIRLLREKDTEVKEAVQKMESNEEVDIDEAVVTTTPLYRQLVDAFAEEQAIEDAIYYLGEGLRKNVIELESFLKRVRELSRKQFILRATIQKCREKAGLPPLV